ncbi:MAG TPA: endonuclease/exonuclease/phosphatase family protein [Bacteroidales bacterium]|nr:endonuclease/exonuclease/phosphatase family protein [Bacteroidales bacterium]
MGKQIFYSLTLLVFLVTGCGKGSKKDAIKVISLNIKHENPNDSLNSWLNRIDPVLEFIYQEDPDIIGMQEVLWTQYTVLDSALDKYASAGIAGEDGFRKGEMNPVFFRKDKFDITRTLTFWLSEEPDSAGSLGWGSLSPRIVTWVELVKKDSHEHLFFFNTRFAEDSDSARLRSSMILNDEIPKIAGSFPFIVAGDFNMFPHSPEYSALAGEGANLSVLQDSYLVSEKKPEGPEFTFNNFSDETGFGRTDYILVKSGLKVYEHTIVPYKKGSIFISNHWPVVATIGLN